MQITLQSLSKRYNHNWIFKNLSYTFTQNNRYAITGNNGSGKSTLLQIIAGAVTYNSGQISYQINNQTNPQITPQQFSIAAPYLEVVEEFTAHEQLQFNSAFKPLTQNTAQVLAAVGLANAANKQIRYFSSGMKQRLKLAQAFFCQSPVLLLDEPTANLDADGIQLYHNLLAQTTNKLVIICSNDATEYQSCNQILHITNYK
jgi:ABC-type multidrug transport system ATPase subunit